MNAPFIQPWRKGDQGLAPTRPAPRTHGWFWAEAEREVGDLYRDRPALRDARVREVYAMLRQIDKHYTRNARI